MTGAGPASCRISAWPLNLNPSLLFIIRVLHARLPRGAHTRYGLKIILYNFAHIQVVKVGYFNIFIEKRKEYLVLKIAASPTQAEQSFSF